MRGDGHLGERAAALVDGELGSDARDRALAHLAHCDACRAEVAAQRRLKARLADLVDPGLPRALLDRLAAVAQDAPADRVAPVPAPAVLPLAARLLTRRSPGRRTGDVVSGGPRGARPGSARRPATRARRRAARFAMAGGSLVAIGVSAFVAGGNSSAPTVVPNVQQLTVQHASTTGYVPFELPIPSEPSVFRQVSAP